ncbi:MAG: hypothetical protein EKK33_01355 [Bradyrhizobiaceae bacterium]|nr:MAG: hypothetical protein EKK33_01355 [Bradyrhizobiaceae bacterium]
MSANVGATSERGRQYQRSGEVSLKSNTQDRCHGNVQRDNRVGTSLSTEGHANRYRGITSSAEMPMRLANDTCTGEHGPCYDHIDLLEFVG